MLLECPNCSANFRIRAGALGDVGRTVRCSRCAFEWFAEPRDLKEAEAAEAPLEQPVEESAAEETHLEEFSEDVLSALGSMDHENSVESALERRAARRREAGPSAIKQPSLLPALAAFAASVLLLIAGAGMYLNETLRGMGLGGLYSALGMERSQGVKLTNLSITQLEGERRPTYMLQGAVVNLSDTEQPIPAVRIRLMTDSGETLREWEYAQPGVMKPQDVLPFSANKLDAMGRKAHHFQVDIGSGFELSLRN